MESAQVEIGTRSRMQTALCRIKQASLILLVSIAAAGWLYVIYNESRANDPSEIVKKHFVFYRDYSRGVWQEAGCAQIDEKKCRQVTYTIAIRGCGQVTFDWRVFSGEDRDSTSWSYNGTNPKLDESKYALYAVLGEDDRLIDSPALGKPFPETCQIK